MSEQSALPRQLTLPQIEALPAPQPLDERMIGQLHAEVRELASERDAVILAHNYQLPEIQQVADFIGDSLALSRHAAAVDQQRIVFCGVHFMAETASILCPHKQVLLPDQRAGCSLADSINAEQLRAWRAEHPLGKVVMYVNTSAEVKALTDYCCTSANAVHVVRHVLESHGPDTEILFGPDMWLGAYVERELGISLHVWDGECHVHAGIRPDDITKLRDQHPDADFLIHPECGCTTSVMEYVAAGDIDSEGVQMLSTGGMLGYAHAAEQQQQETEELQRAGVGQSSATSRSAPGATMAVRRQQVVVATEVGMLYGLQQAAPDVEFIPANPRASCAFMKMITLPRLRDALLLERYEVRVDAETAERARLPIERMIAIG